MCDLSQQALNRSLRDGLYCATACCRGGEILRGEQAVFVPACPADRPSGLCSLECDCSSSSPLFAPPLLRCHNGSRPGLDGGVMGVIKRDPRGAMRRRHMHGSDLSLWNSGPRCCRRTLPRRRNAAGDVYNYMTSRTLTGEHPQTAAMFLCWCARGRVWMECYNRALKETRTCLLPLLFFFLKKRK